MVRVVVAVRRAQMEQMVARELVGKVVRRAHRELAGETGLRVEVASREQVGSMEQRALVVRRVLREHREHHLA